MVTEPVILKILYSETEYVLREFLGSLTYHYGKVMRPFPPPTNF